MEKGFGNVYGFMFRDYRRVPEEWARGIDDTRGLGVL